MQSLSAAARLFSNGSACIAAARVYSGPQPLPGIMKYSTNRQFCQELFPLCGEETKNLAEG
jgi:hypothetical protein